jgi:hydrogenase maturation protein HypF
MAVDVKEGRRIELRGTVQGVGMRPWIYRIAHDYGITGRVWNQGNGVTITAFGDGGALDAFVKALGSSRPPAAVVEGLETASIDVEEAREFVIIDSSRGDGRRVSIPPDLATCDECAAEIFDPSNRRYRYPFTNCTNCGPRFTIATDVPYDRPATTMAPFPMCRLCQREYDDPANRRFHAQPNACPVCGPRLTAMLPGGQPVATANPIAYAAAELQLGHIVAVKGIGGFHLACDALSSAAVARLRERKHRDEKPFAVMARDLAAAERIGALDDAARRLLTSTERPIVVVPRRPGSSVCNEVAPRNPLIGLMLPYTPLHHLLLADAGTPLVMTSGNLAEEPIVYRNDEALERLGDIADLLLVHDREIVTRCDDSVMRIVSGAPMVIRRSRGFVPRAISLPVPVAVPVLGCGALLKNTFCIAHRDRAWLGPHIGDLENVETYEAYQDAIARMERFLGVRGEVVAHDLHPDYLSTRYAHERNGTMVGVQHHHAHVASAIAEHRLAGPVIGVAFDGTGYGMDGTAWGGECFVGDPAAVARVATFRPVLLAGGDTAIKQPWRIALALLDDALRGAAPLDCLRLFDRVAPPAIDAVQQMLTARVNTPRARGVGRYFDGFGALALARSLARYEGQIAFDFNMVLDPRESGAYRYHIDRSTQPMEIDLRPAVCSLVEDLLDGVRTPLISARFHNTITAATVGMVRDAATVLGTRARPAVVLTGGCFQNAYLAERASAALTRDFDVYLHRDVPPGDGGIALGQAVIAAALVER